MGCDDDRRCRVFWWMTVWLLIPSLANGFVLPASFGGDLSGCRHASSVQPPAIAVITEDLLVSDDPVKQHFIPLVKEILDCRTKAVAYSGRHVLKALHATESLDQKWVNTAMKCWRKHTNPLEAAQCTEALFQMMLTLSERHSNLEPDSFGYHAVVGAWVHHATVTQDLRSMKCAQQHVQNGWANWHSKRYITRPSLHSYFRLFLGWLYCSRNHPTAYQEMKVLFADMRQHRLDGFAEFKPDEHFRQKFLDFLNRKRNHGAQELEGLEGVLHGLEQPLDDDDDNDKSMLTFSVASRKELIFGYIQNGHPDTVAAKLSQLLHEVWELCESSNDLRPRAKLFTQFISVARESKQYDAYERARVLVEEMWKQYDKTGDEAIKPNNIIYNVLSDVLLRTKDGHESACHTRELLDEMWSKGIQPSPFNYREALKSLSYDTKENSGVEANAILQELWRIYDQDPVANKSLKPDAIVYSMVMKVWTRCGRDDAGDKAEQLLRDMLDRGLVPSNVHYNQVISTLGIRAKVLVEEMWQRHDEMGDASVKPDRITYSSLMIAMSRGGGDAVRMTNLLQEMWDKHHAGDAELRPDIINYNDAFKALASIGNHGAGIQAERLLEQVWKLHEQDPIQNHGLKPNSQLYSAVLQVWSKSKSRESGRRAEALLRDMWKRYNEGDKNMKPSTVHYNQVITAAGNDPTGTQPEHFLQEMWEHYQVSGKLSIKPDRITYNSLISALGQPDVEDAVERAKNVLQEMWDISNAGDKRIQPNLINYRDFLAILSLSKNKNAGAEAEGVVRELWRLYEGGIHSIKPNNFLYSAALQVGVKSKSKDAADVAEALLSDMWQRYKNGDKKLKPLRVHYNQIIACMGYGDQGDGAARAEKWFREMCDLYRVGDASLAPDSITYSTLLKVLSDSKTVKTKRLRQLLQEMREQYDAGNVDSKPDLSNFRDILTAFSFCGNEDAGTEAEEVLQELWDMYNQDKVKNLSLKPQESIYSATIQVWSKSKNEDAGFRAERLLRDMWGWYRDGHEDLKPRNVHYNQVIAAMASTRPSSDGWNEDGSVRAQELVQEMWELYHETGDKWLKPCKVTYKTLVRVLSTSKMKNAKERAVEQLAVMWEKTRAGHRELMPEFSTYIDVMKALLSNAVMDTGAQAESILQEMWDMHNENYEQAPKPNPMMYSNVIQAWSKSKHKDAGNKAEALLRDMWKRYRDGDEDMRPLCVHYNQVIHAFSNHADDASGARAFDLIQEMWEHHEAGNEWLKPDRFTYGSTLIVLRQSGTRTAGERVQCLLGEMWEKYHQGDQELKPNLVNYKDAVGVSCMDTSKAGGTRAEGFLRDLWDIYNKDKAEHYSLKPDSMFYSSVIQAWSKNKSTDAVGKAEALLREMWDRYHDGDTSLKPRCIHYNQVINAMGYDQNGYDFRTRELVQEMWDNYHETGDTSIKPDHITYNSLLSSFPRRKVEGSGIQAIEVLKEMWELYHAGDKELEPNLLNYNDAFGALAIDANDEARTQAKALLQELWDLAGSNPSLKPNAILYSYAMKVWSADGRTTEAFLREMWDRYHQGEHNMKPTNIQYNQVIFSLSNDHNYEDAEARAEALVQEMWDYYRKTGDLLMKPTQVTYNVLLGCTKHSCEKSLRIIKDMWALHESGEADIKPTMSGYREVLRSMLSDGDEKTGEQAGRVLRELWDRYDADTIGNIALKPNASLCAFAMQVYAGCKNRGADAEHLLRDMWERYKNGDEDMKPRALHYNHAIAALCNDTNGAASRAEALVQDMWDHYRETGDHTIRPDATTLTLVATLLENTKDGHNQAQQLLQDIQETQIIE